MPSGQTLNFFGKVGHSKVQFRNKRKNRIQRELDDQTDIARNTEPFIFAILSDEILIGRIIGQRGKTNAKVETKTRTLVIIFFRAFECQFSGLPRFRTA